MKKSHNYNKKKLLRRYKRISRSLNRKLTDFYGNSFAEMIKNEAQQEFEGIVINLPHFSGKVNLFRQIMFFCGLAIAYYRPLKKNGKTVEESMIIFYEFIDEFHRKIPRVFRWFIRKLFFSSIFLKIIQKAAKNVSDHPEGWKMTYYKGDKKECDWYFEATECAVIKLFKNEGVPEMAKYCNFIDYIQSNVFGLGLIQKGCLGAGDETCIECMKQGRSTPIPDNLQNIIKNQVSYD
ncbi:MAG: hypothetical protein FK733_13680 [Asgard group archaeon]|nr:hypothetical protein [Asgard group archaeon]